MKDILALTAKAFNDGFRYVVNEGGTRCLSGDTLVCTPKGYIQIMDIEVGDYVYSVEGNKCEPKKVLNKFVYSGVQTKIKSIIFGYSNQLIRCTYDHKFRVKGKYIEAFLIAERAMEDIRRKVCSFNNGPDFGVLSAQQKPEHIKAGHNEGCENTTRIFENTPSLQADTGSQGGSRGVYSKPGKQTTGKPQRRKQVKQQSGKSGVGNTQGEFRPCGFKWLGSKEQGRGKRELEIYGGTDTLCESKQGYEPKETIRDNKHSDNGNKRHQGWQDLELDKITSVEYTETDGYVFDIEVEDFHSFLITPENIVSHNSSKTFTVLGLLYNIAASRPVLISVVSETYPHLRKGAIRDFQKILEDWGVWDETKWAKVESTYSLPNGSKIEFFSVDSPGKVHGPARNILFINEAQNISFDIARHLFVRTTGQIFIDFNPTHEFWAHTELKPDKDCAWVHSTYKDNPFLTANQVKEIERGKKNQNWWQVYGLGQIGQLEGLIFPAFSFCDTLPDADRVAYGLDFGFSNDPTALIRIATRGDDLYLDEVIYQTELTNREIVQLLKQHGLKPHYDEIIADSAEPKSIHEIRQAGFNIKPAVKGPDSIRAGIDRMLSFNIHITKQSTNLIKEFRNYTWVKDKEGKATGKPVDMYNHGIDAVRYAIQTKTAKNFVL